MKSMSEGFELTSTTLFNKLPWTYCAILQNLGHAVHCFTLTGEIIYWNAAAEALYGYRAEEVAGKNILALLCPDSDLRAAEKIIARQALGVTWRGHFPLKKRNGEVFEAFCTNTPLRNDQGVIIGVIGVVCDIGTLAAPSKGPSFRTGSSFFDGLSTNGRLSQLTTVEEHSRSDGKLGILPSWFQKITYSASQMFDILLHPLSATAGKGLEVLLGKRGSEVIFGWSWEILKTQNDGTLRREESLQRQQSLRRTQSLLCSNGAIVPESDRCRDEDESERADQQSSGATSISGNSQAHVQLSQSEHRAGQQFPGATSISGNSQARIQLSKSDVTTTSSSSGEGSGIRRDLEGGDWDTDFDGDDRKDISEAIEAVVQSVDNLTTSSGIPWDELEVKDPIGEGSYATVYHALWSGSHVAVKMFTQQEYTPTLLEDFKKEVTIMKRARHPNILLFMGIVALKDQLGIVTEFMPRGSLYRVLHKTRQTIDVQRRLRMALDITTGMIYLHKSNPPIVHRDLKSSNLLVDKHWNVKIGDFGLSKFKHNLHVTTRSARGTPQWMAPEVLMGDAADEKADVYSFGVILWELCTRKVPWKNLSPVQVIGAVGFQNRRLENPDDLDPSLTAIIDRCLTRDPDARPNFVELTEEIRALVRSTSS